MLGGFQNFLQPSQFRLILQVFIVPDLHFSTMVTESTLFNRTHGALILERHDRTKQHDWTDKQVI